MIGTFRLGNGSSFRPLATLYCRPCRFALMVRPELRRSSSLAYPDVVQVPEVPMEESLDSIAESLGSNTGVVAHAPAVPTEVKSTLTPSSSCTDIVHVQVGRIFPTILLSHAQVAAAFSRMLPDAPECFSSWYQYLWPQDGHLTFWPSGLLAYWIQNGLDRDRRSGCSRSTSYNLSRDTPQCTRLRFAAEMLRRGPGARLELLTRLSSIRFCFLFCTSGRMKDRRSSGN